MAKRVRKKDSDEIIKIANKVIRLPIWRLDNTKDNGSGKVKKSIYKYGETRVVIHGELLEKDRGVLFALLALSKLYDNSRTFDFELSDIAKIKGASNPYDEKVLEPIRESIDRLFDVQIRLKPTKRKGFTGKFTFIEGGLNSDDTGNISVSPYIDVVNTFKLGTSTIHLKTYNSIRKGVARSLFTFIKDQRPFYTGNGYKIRTTKLVKYLAMDNTKPFFQTRSLLNAAVEELEELDLIGKHKYEKNEYKTDGGLWTFYPIKIKYGNEIDDEGFIKFYPEDWQNDDVFCKSAKDFFNHRIEINKPLTPYYAEKMAKNHKKYKKEELITAFDRAVENGWKGVFPMEKKEMQKEMNKPRTGYMPKEGYKHRKADKTV